MNKANYEMNLEYRQRQNQRFVEQRTRGEAMLYNGATQDERVRGAEHVVDALWERSCMAIEGHPRAAEHPEYIEFMRMLDLPRIFARTPDVPPELTRRCGPPIVGVIAPGDVYWRPRRRRGRTPRRR